MILNEQNNLEANKAVVRRYMDEVLNGRDVDALDEIAAEDYLDHPAFPGQGPGREGMKYRISYLLAALDPRWTAQDLIAEGDLVVTRWTLAGTQRGEFLGIQADRQGIHPQGDRDLPGEGRTDERALERRRYVRSSPAAGPDPVSRGASLSG